MEIIKTPEIETVNDESIVKRATDLFNNQMDSIALRASHMFAGLMVGQWLLGILFALWVSPRTWAGSASQTHIHMFAAVILGGFITSFPVYLALRWPTWTLTRHVIAAGQILMSALLIHLTGGRIETHFHVFGSLAFLAVYRDWRILITATVIVAMDHGLRGIFWPQSVYGVAAIQPLRFLEHAGWVVFTDVFLIYSMRQSLKEMQGIAEHQAQLEMVNQVFEQKVLARTADLEEANERILESERRVQQSEKLSAVGQLAAGIAHEINNPLGVILAFSQSIVRRIQDADPLAMPLKSIEREAIRCKNLVQSLLTFSRQNKLSMEACNLNEAVESTMAIIEAHARVRSVEIVKELDSPPPILANKNQIQQIIVNLCQNSADAMPNGGKITIRTRKIDPSGSLLSVLEVEDTGCGIPEDVQDKIFNPFFTTKEVGKGTGLGLSIVYEIVQRHKGSIEFVSKPGMGTTFTVTFPAAEGKSNGNRA